MNQIDPIVPEIFQSILKTEFKVHIVCPSVKMFMQKPYR